MRFHPLLLVAGLMACARPDKSADSVASPPAPQVVTIVASDFAFESPDTISSGVTTFKLVATSGLHHASLVRLNEGKSFADLTQALQGLKPTDPIPAWITLMGGPNPPAVGDTATAIHDLAAGQYALICVVDIPDHIPHAAKGMMRPLVVVPAPADAPAAPAPTADVTMTLVDYGFELSAPLTAGDHVIKVSNTAQQPHEYFLVRLDSGKTMADFGKWAETFEGPPPGRPMGGVAGMAPGATAYVPVRLTAGNYLLLCFIPDVKDGQPHLMHGMAQEFTVP